MDQATLEELAPGLVVAYTAEEISNKIDAREKKPKKIKPEEPAKKEIEDLLDLLTAHESSIEINGGIDSISRKAGIHPVHGRPLIKQYQKLVAYRLAETAVPND